MLQRRAMLLAAVAAPLGLSACFGRSSKDTVEAFFTYVAAGNHQAAILIVSPHERAIWGDQKIFRVLIMQHNRFRDKGGLSSLVFTNENTRDRNRHSYSVEFVYGNGEREQQRTPVTLVRIDGDWFILLN